jgi:ankyrin repeat protein
MQPCNFSVNYIFIQLKKVFKNEKKINIRVISATKIFFSDLISAAYQKLKRLINRKFTKKESSVEDKVKIAYQSAIPSSIAPSGVNSCTTFSITDIDTDIEEEYIEGLKDILNFTLPSEISITELINKIEQSSPEAIKRALKKIPLPVEQWKSLHALIGFFPTRLPAPTNLIAILKDMGLDFKGNNNSEQTPLIYAIEHNRYDFALEIVKYSEKDNFDLLCEPRISWIRHQSGAIHFLIANGYKEKDYFNRPILESSLGVIKKMIEKGAHLDLLNSNGDTPLHLACLRRDFDTAQYLLEKGADANIQNSSGKKPIDLLAVNYETAKEELEKISAHVHIEENSFNDKLYLDSMMQLLKTHTEAFDQEDWKANQYFHQLKIIKKPSLLKGIQIIQSLTHVVECLNQENEKIKALTIKLLDINYSYNEGETLLHILAKTGNSTQVIHLLMGCGADFKKQDSWGNTPLMWAIANANNTTAMEIIEQAGTPEVFNIQDTLSKHNNTALHLAIAKGYKTLSFNREKLNYSNHQLVDWMVKLGADVNIPNYQGNTPIHLACLRRDLEMLSSLLSSREARLDMTNKNGQTPFDLLSENYSSTNQILESTTVPYLLDESAFEDENNLHQIKLILEKHKKNLLLASK